MCRFLGGWVGERGSLGWWVGGCACGLVSAWVGWCTRVGWCVGWWACVCVGFWVSGLVHAGVLVCGWVWCWCSGAACSRDCAPSVLPSVGLPPRPSACRSPLYPSAASCADVKCQRGEKCRRRDGVPRCVCAPKCRGLRVARGPVCGNDGRTYRNYCKLLRRQCRKKSSLQLAYKGSCRSRCSGGPRSS